MLLTGADAGLIGQMGMHAYDDAERMLGDLDLSGKLTYAIPNGSTVVPSLVKQED